MSADRILVPRLHRGTVAGPDGIGPGTDAAQLRSERVGNPDEPGDGRVYHIDFGADDGRGGECSVTVCVPHDRGDADGCVDQGPLFDSTLAAAPASGLGFEFALLVAQPSALQRSRDVQEEAVVVVTQIRQVL